MYRSFEYLVKVKATRTGKLLDSLPRNDMVSELCHGKRLNCAMVNSVLLTAISQRVNCHYHHF
jgi:hypothetical protein